MAHTARGSIAELLQTIDGGTKLSPKELDARLRFIYQQVGELLDRQAKVRSDYEARIGELEDFIQNGPKDGPERDRPAAYSKLMDVLSRAYDQAADGKGKDRHVKTDGQRFEDQPICTLQRIFGTGYAFGQASKKAEESTRLPRDRAVAELLGAINYLAAAVIVREESEE